MFGLTHGEWFVVAFCMIAVVSARYWPLLGERIALLVASKPPRAGQEHGPGPRVGVAASQAPRVDWVRVVLEPPSGGDSGGASSEAFIFVSDASAEAERLTASLRSRGYLVVDVPLGLLLGRVGAQRPAIVLCDADAPDALDTIERVRDVPGAEAIEILFFHDPGRTTDSRAAVLGNEVFPRPVDVEALSKKVEKLIGRPARRSNRPSAVPLGSRAPVLVAATRRPYRYDTRARPSALPRAADPGGAAHASAADRRIAGSDLDAPLGPRGLARHCRSRVG